jgi:hypothetical protein
MWLIIVIFSLIFCLNLMGSTYNNERNITMVFSILPVAIFSLIVYADILFKQEKQKLITLKEKHYSLFFYITILCLWIELFLFLLSGLNDIFSDRSNNSYGIGGSEQQWYALFISGASITIFFYYFVILVIKLIINIFSKFINNQKNK